MNMRNICEAFLLMVVDLNLPAATFAILSWNTILEAALLETIPSNYFGKIFVSQETDCNQYLLWVCCHYQETCQTWHKIKLVPFADVAKHHISSG